MPMISVITVVFNGSETIAETIQSVDAQTYPFVEHIIVDGASTDATMAIVQNYRRPNRRVISEKDEGLYDAMNKGASLARGDIIGFLNADDIYDNADVLSQIANAFRDPETNVAFGDLIYFNGTNPNKVVRRYSSKHFRPKRLSSGWMPAHPTIYMRQQTFIDIGPFQINYSIAADFEHCVRLFSKKTQSYFYIPSILVQMRKGGISTRGLKSKIKIALEIRKALTDNNFKISYFGFFHRYIIKLIS
jgi:glycosyltransferase involved in cell wall biosynthesis